MNFLNGDIFGINLGVCASIVLWLRGNIRWVGLFGAHSRAGLRRQSWQGCVVGRLLDGRRLPGVVQLQGPLAGVFEPLP